MFVEDDVRAHPLLDIVFPVELASSSRPKIQLTNDLLVSTVDTALSSSVDDHQAQSIKQVAQRLCLLPFTIVEL